MPMHAACCHHSLYHCSLQKGTNLAGNGAECFICIFGGDADSADIAGYACSTSNRCLTLLACNAAGRRGPLQLPHTHTHTHTHASKQKEKERDKERRKETATQHTSAKHQPKQAKTTNQNNTLRFKNIAAPCSFLFWKWPTNTLHLQPSSFLCDLFNWV